MAFDIDKMKTDGVSPHLIELAELSERDDTAAFEKIAMGIENTEIFRDFISMESGALAWDYMYAAGMCTKDEADWFKDPNNPYGEGSDKGEVWATSADGELELTINSDGSTTGSGITAKAYADWVDLFNNPQNYSVKAHYAFATSSLDIDADGVFADEDKMWTCNRVDGFSGYTCEAEIVIAEDESSIDVSGSGSYFTPDVSEEVTRIEIIVTKK